MSDAGYKFNIPEEIYGQVIDGIDLQILGSDSVRIIEAYVKQEGELSEIQTRILHLCERELSVVIPKTEGQSQRYFVQLHDGVLDVIRKLSQSNGS